MAMQRSWSGDSLASSLLDKPSYIATFDASRPRQHRRRASLHVIDSPEGPDHNSLEPPASSSSRQVHPDRKVREHQKTVLSSLRPRNSNCSPTLNRRIPILAAPNLTSSPSSSDDVSKTRKKLRLSPADDAEYISAYAAEPSSGNEARLRQAQESSIEDSSSETEAFQWDKKSTRHSSLAATQAARSLLASAPRQWHKTGLRETSPFGRLKTSTVQIVGDVDPPGSSSRHRHLSPALLSRYSKDVVPAAEVPDRRDAAVLDGCDGTPSPRPVVQGGGRLLSKTLPPSGASRFGKGFNASAEILILLATALWACWQLALEDEPLATVKAGELGVAIALSTLYIALANGPSLIWSTEARCFRPSADDGAMCGLLLGPLLAATMLIASLEEDSSTLGAQVLSPNGRSLPQPPWFVEGPLQILVENRRLDVLKTISMSALSLSRCTLLSLQTMISMIFLSHLSATRWFPQQAAQSSWGRLGSFTGVSMVITLVLYVLREAFGLFDIPLWTGLARWELISASVLFQANMYAISRLGRRSFTLGELGIVAALGVTLMIEATNLSLAKLLPHAIPYVKTFRRVTPLLIFQLALIVGTFFVGFLLSPLLYLSRHLAQKPLHRLRWPHKRDLHRRLLAGFFFFFAALYVVGALGLWVRWLLGQRDPWIWTIRFIVLGKSWWTRPTLIMYWLSCIIGSITGWSTVVARAKRFRTNASAIGKAFAVQPLSTATQVSAGTLNPTAHSTAREVALAKGKRTTHLSLNARRKFFHALAVIMYVPAIAFDPAFTHLAFSLAFSVFTFAEYIRYYALYPFGAAFHIFMSEFTDHKDSGPVILSHFYLLTGCCGGLWLEAHKQIMHQTGVLVLGVGDALASIVGRKYGRVHWPGSSKTIEGSAAFLISVVSSAWTLRLLGWCQDFSLLRYTGVVSILCLIEGVSEQNDNLILPIYGFIYLSLAHI